jgi:hypothetical protein
MADLSSVAKVILTAEDRTSPAFQSVENAVDGLHSKLTGFISGGLAALGAALSIDSFGQMLHGVIETQAHLQDLADKVGTTVSALSQLAPAAKLSGTAMDDVAAFSAKFSKTLASIVEGNEKATAAFKAFGFSVQDAAKYLDDPIAGLQELAKHFGNAVNDGNRTAAMMELLGKNASNAAPFLKQLAEMGELHTTVTNEQAAAAKRLEDQWTIMQSAGNGLKNTMATMVAEALAPMIEKFNLARAAGLGFGDALASVSRSGEDDSKYISSLRDRIAELSGTVEEARRGPRRIARICSWTPRNCGRTNRASPNWRKHIAGHQGARRPDLREPARQFLRGRERSTAAKHGGIAVESKDRVSGREDGGRHVHAGNGRGAQVAR